MWRFDFLQTEVIGSDSQDKLQAASVSSIKRQIQVKRLQMKRSSTISSSSCERRRSGLPPATEQKRGAEDALRSFLDYTAADKRGRTGDGGEGGPRSRLIHPADLEAQREKRRPT